jgi:hypothetical protein
MPGSTCIEGLGCHVTHRRHRVTRRLEAQQSEAPRCSGGGGGGARLIELREVLLRAAHPTQQLLLLLLLLLLVRAAAACLLLRHHRHRLLDLGFCEELRQILGGDPQCMGDSVYTRSIHSTTTTTTTTIYIQCS